MENKINAFGISCYMLNSKRTVYAMPESMNDKHLEDEPFRRCTLYYLFITFGGKYVPTHSRSEWASVTADELPTIHENVAGA